MICHRSAKNGREWTQDQKTGQVTAKSGRKINNIFGGKGGSGWRRLGEKKGSKVIFTMRRV